ncbi:hypothetical protein DW878_05085 [Olsenella sp. AM39-30AC]|nr:hypothetical protein DW878_05085 [Olsenella sp. AM39-30AC]
MVDSRRLWNLLAYSDTDPDVPFFSGASSSSLRYSSRAFRSSAGQFFGFLLLQWYVFLGDLTYLLDLTSFPREK